MEIAFEIRSQGKSQKERHRLPSSWQEVEPMFTIKSFRREIGLSILLFDTVMAFTSIYKHTVGSNIYKLTSADDIDYLIRHYNFIDFNQLPAYALIPSFPLKDTIYHFPQPKFNHATMGEFILMTDFIKKYVDGDDHASWQLLALLARPIDHKLDTEDTRIPFFLRKDVDIQAKYLKSKWNFNFSKLYEYRGVAVAYALGVITYIYDTYKTTLFRPSKSKQVYKPALDFGWYATALQVAESGVFGDINQVLKTPFHNICVYLIEKQQQADAIKAIQSLNTHE